MFLCYDTNLKYYITSLSNDKMLVLTEIESICRRQKQVKVFVCDIIEKRSGKGERSRYDHFPNFPQYLQIPLVFFSRLFLVTDEMKFRFYKRE